MECNQKIVIAKKMQQLRDEILELSNEKGKFVNSPSALQLLEGTIRRKQNRIVLLHFDYNMAD